MKYRLILFILWLSACLAACVPGIQSNDPAAHVQPVALDDFAATLYLPPYLPQDLRQSLQLPAGTLLTEDAGNAEIRLDVSGDAPVGQWTYALVGPFATLEDEVSLKDLKAFWSGMEGNSFPAARIILQGETQTILTKLWGSPNPKTIVSLPAESLQNTAWLEKTTWAIIPFEQLDPQWKVISVNGNSPIDKEFDPTTYALNVPFSFVGKVDILTEFLQRFNANNQRASISLGNWDANKLTIVAMTGSTALVRGTASIMEKYGMTYPAVDIGGVLRNADITHISNEIPFTQTCPEPLSSPGSASNPILCSQPEYIQLLESLGADVIELTGDHFRGIKKEVMDFTLGLYDQRGWLYYGGGRNLADGQKPALIEHNGNRIAFLGCNAKPTGYATASQTSPGAAHCDLAVMAEKVKQASAQGYLPVFTFQHIEYYDYAADSHLVVDFQRMAEAGAVIVSGSQAHQPHALEFYRSDLLHYGLGELFYDPSIIGFATQEAFIDLHVFYDGRYISTRLVSIVFGGQSRPRLMTMDERQTLLKNVFFASNW